ncbi:hypothetical protein HYX12_05010 [Candidatus Woesearchaeota archaeon]|nr:hypothetical protein [Candidatus Woesearchaeota archaeon]
MAEQRLFDNPNYLRQFAQMYSFPTLEELGFAGCSSAKVEVEAAPKKLREMQGVIADFWGGYEADLKARGQSPTNDPKYGTLGLPGVRREHGVLEHGVLIVNVFESDYATTVFSGPRRGEEWTSRLSADQLKFLEGIATLGVVNVIYDSVRGDHIEDNSKILLGIKAGTRITGGLWESLGTGLVDPHTLNRYEDPFRGATRHELLEETGLSLDHDVDRLTPFGFSIGMSYGEFSLVSTVDLVSRASEKVVISAEHDYGAFLSSPEIDKIPVTRMNPVTAGVLRKLNLYHRN